MTFSEEQIDTKRQAILARKHIPRHIAIIIEAGVRKQLLLNEGINPARELEKKIMHKFCP